MIYPPASKRQLVKLTPRALTIDPRRIVTVQSGAMV
jgi:hypothetical protein